LSRTGTFEAFFDALAAMTETAHLVQVFDSTVVRAHVSAAGAKGGKTVRLSVAHVVDFSTRFTWDRFRRPAHAFHLTGGEASDSRNFQTLLGIGPDINPRAVLGAKGYDSKSNRQAAVNGEYVQQSRIDPTPKTCPRFFQKFFTRAALASSNQSANSNDSNASHYAARRQRLPDVVRCHENSGLSETRHHERPGHQHDKTTGKPQRLRQRNQNVEQ
jgi:hypothetical protein